MLTVIVTRVDQTEFPVKNITSLRIGRNGKDEGALIFSRGIERVGCIRAGLWMEWRYDNAH